MDDPLIEMAAKRGRIRLRMRCLKMGRDLCVTLSGGDREHIGAVALGEPGSCASVLALRGHREDELAGQIATELAAGTGAAVSVACGIHVDGLRPEELTEVLAMAGELTGRLLERLRDEGR